MNDDLDARLERLASTPVGPRPPVGELQGKDRRRSANRARTALAVAAAVIVVGGVGLYAQSAKPPPEVTSVGGVSDPGVSPPPDDLRPAFDELGIPISGPGGSIAGWVDRDEWNGTNGPPVLDIGTGAVEVRGFEVRDAAGVLTGYFLAGAPGFVSIEFAADPEAVDRLVTANPQLAQEEMKQLYLDGMSRFDEQSGD